MNSSGLPYDPISDVQSFQHEANLAIGPSFFGWSLQLLVSGATFHAAIQHLNPQTSVFDRRTRLVAWAVCCLNFVVVGFTFYEVYFWGSIQATSIDTLYQFTVIDAIVSIPTGLLAAIVQAFFAKRAWKVVKENKVFVLVVGLGWITAVAGSIAVAVESLLPQDDDEAYFNVLVATQVWLWSSAFVDFAISAVLVSSLYRYKEGWQSRSNDTFIWLMQLAFQTVALTTLFVLAASITALVTYKYASASVYYALQYPIPALYAFSFIWSLETVAIARKKNRLPSTGNMSSSRCTSCQNPNFGIWPYTNGVEQVALPTLQQVLTRHEEPGSQSTNSRMSLSAFLKPAHHTCKRSKAGKGSTASLKVEDQPNLPPSPDLASIHIEVETAHRVETRTPGVQLSRSNSAYFTPL